MHAFMREICRTILFVISEYVRAADRNVRSCDNQRSTMNLVVVVVVVVVVGGAEAEEGKSLSSVGR